jgi:hypothetical protein
MAKYDEKFKARLFDDREKTIFESGLDFTPGEKLLLANISDEQLAANIDEFWVPGVTKNSLPSWAKAAAVILLLSSIVLADGDARADRKPKYQGSFTFKYNIPRSMGIIPSYGPPGQKPRTAEIKPKINSFTKFKSFTPGMLKTLNEIKLKLASEVKIGDIMEAYDSTIDEEYTIADEEKTIKPEVENLINEIKEKIGSGMDINAVIKQYEAVIY